MGESLYQLDVQPAQMSCYMAEQRVMVVIGVSELHLAQEPWVGCTIKATLGAPDEGCFCMGLFLKQSSQEYYFQSGVECFGQLLP